jgi:hypothetical protein
MFFQIRVLSAVGHRAKKQYADKKKYATQTGGGPPAKELSNETEKIVDMMKDCSSFVK